MLHASALLGLVRLSATKGPRRQRWLKFVADDDATAFQTRLARWLASSIRSTFDFVVAQEVIQSLCSHASLSVFSPTLTLVSPQKAVIMFGSFNFGVLDGLCKEVHPYGDAA
jgi:hypothetical protein